MRAPSLLPAALAAALMLLALPAAGQEAAATVTVHASDTGLPLAGAQVSVREMNVRATTDASGRASLTGLPAGSRALVVRYLGYAPEEVVVTLTPDRVASVALSLRVQPIALAAVAVRAQRSRLQDTGFFQRRSGGFGTFVTREDIERMRPRFLSDVLRRVAGISLQSSAYGGTSRASMRGNKVLGGCPIQYYVDGTMTGFFNIDEVQPQDVEGLEIYRGAATIPPAYNKGSAMCGVIVIWTRVQ